MTSTDNLLNPGILLVGQADLDAGFFATNQQHHIFRDFLFKYVLGSSDNSEKYLPAQQKLWNGECSDASECQLTVNLKTTNPIALEKISPNATMNTEISTRKSKYNETSYKIKITFAVRFQNRRILNLPALLSTIALQSDIVDMDWLQKYVLPIEQFPWREQVTLCSIFI